MTKEENEEFFRLYADMVKTEEREKKYKKALEDIVKHMKIVCPTGTGLSTVYFLATRALGDDTPTE